MVQKMEINAEAVDASMENTLAVEQFLRKNYLLRRNVLSGKVEFANRVEDLDDRPEFRPLTKEALNSIVIKAKREQICEKGSPKSEIAEYVYSEEVEAFDPIGTFLGNLPAWNGENHVARLFSRLPGLTTEQMNFLAVWLRSVVAHWLQMDTLHGNECVPTLIGDQGCGKTTFFRRLLPPEFRQYYLDHLNLSNKFDKEMALTNNLLVNLDELDAIRPSQHSELKQTLSKNKVNGRPIFGNVQEDRPRYASFVSTTNNPHPLTDATGSRRYICVRIPKGQCIDNGGDIDYEQLYAQVCHELKEQKAPYWFNNEEVKRIQQLNNGYRQEKDLNEIVPNFFRKPADNEVGTRMSSRQIIEIISVEYPYVAEMQGVANRLGFVLKKMGIKGVLCAGRNRYAVVQQIVA